MIGPGEPWLLPEGDAAAALALLLRVAASPAALPALLGAAALVAWYAATGRLGRIRALLRDETASAAAMDLVMVVPLFTYIMLLFLQFAILMQDAQLVRYAAFVAARSARVHLCSPIPAATLSGSVLAFLRGRPCDNDKGQAEAAARYVLIAASPSDSALRCLGSCTPPTGALAALAGGAGMRIHLDALTSEARYAFDLGTDGPNVAVAVDIPLLGTLLSLPGDGRIREHPGHARVTFRHLLLPLMGVVYGSGKRSDGIWYSLMSAEATVL